MSSSIEMPLLTQFSGGAANSQENPHRFNLLEPFQFPVLWTSSRWLHQNFSHQNICFWHSHLAKCFVDGQTDVLSFFLAAFLKDGLALLHLLLHPLQVEEVGDVDTELAVLAVQVQGSVEATWWLNILSAPGQIEIFLWATTKYFEGRFTRLETAEFQSSWQENFCNEL